MGHLSLIIGCMFAQKTTELLRRIRRYQSIGYRVLVVNYSADTRYGKNCIASHDKEFEKAICVDHLGLIDEMVRSGLYDVVAIDEGQFFPDLYSYSTAWADHLPIDIVISGLDGSSKREPIGDILLLIPHAEEVERLNAFCSMCRNRTIAVYSKNIGKEMDGNIEIGGADRYQPVCRKHYHS